MRIKQISVTGLFGMFDHVIPLNMEDRITIIYGLNGIGKTAILRLLNGFFNLRYSELRIIPFREFQMNFDDNSYLKITKKIRKKSTSKITNNDNITVIFKKDSTSEEEILNLEPMINNLKKGYIEADIDDFSDIQQENIYSEFLGQKWTSRANSRKAIDYQQPKLLLFTFDGKIELEENPEWWKNIIENIRLRFIESQRLLNLSKSSKSEESQFSMTLSVTKYAQELAKSIQDKLAEYGTLSQSLDRSFPNRILQQQEIVKMPDEDLRNKLSELEEKRQELINAGFLDKEENSNFQIPEKIDDSTNKLLSVYVEDVEKKLSVFDDLAQRIELFKRIINQRFSYKQITISRDKGFTFTCNGHDLSPDKLSSGEQHELIILYELLFKVQPNSLILIDEPEISLHVEWQVHFLKDLQEITQIAGVDVLMATHSPDIINGQWDLTVELKGTQK